MTTAAAVEQIDEQLAAAVSEGVVTGAAAMAADDYGLTFASAHGFRAEGEPWSADTVAWLGSMARPIVAAGALQLAERGLLTLDEPIGMLLPELAEPHVLVGFDRKGDPRASLDHYETAVHRR